MCPIIHPDNWSLQNSSLIFSQQLQPFSLTPSPPTFGFVLVLPLPSIATSISHFELFSSTYNPNRQNEKLAGKVQGKGYKYLRRPTIPLNPEVLQYFRFFKFLEEIWYINNTTKETGLH